MRRRHLLIFILCCWIIHTPAQDTLLLFHPTADNLDIIENLCKEGLIDLEGYHVLGVYHAGESYDYALARERLNELPGSRYSLREITGDLEPDDIYRINECSKDFEKLFHCSRGALFMGGPDIPPALYHEPAHLLTAVTDPYRHFLEISFLFHLLGGGHDPGWIPWMESDPNYLVSGICLGMQSMHIATGGTLIQDIPTEVYGIWIAEEILAMMPDQVHRNYADMVDTWCENPTSYHFHRIKLENGSFLQKNVCFNEGTGPLVLSSHHQAVEAPGSNWTISATSMDGKIIEAIEHKKYPHVVGVQFHPEKPGLFNPDIIHPESCDTRINFQEKIRNTESYQFHTSYWKNLGKILQKLREK
jgi:putative glutamine amidotransferase